MLLKWLVIYNFRPINDFIDFLMIVPFLVRIIVFSLKVTTISMWFSLCQSLLKDYDPLNI